MTTTDILRQIDVEIATLKQARSIITGTPTASAKKTAPKPKKKSKMSPEGRARIAGAQKKRWAALKKAAAN
jgi:hypothetical protein